MCVRTLYGFGAIWSQIFFLENFTKLDLALKKVIKNRSSRMNFAKSNLPWAYNSLKFIFELFSRLRKLIKNTYYPERKQLGRYKILWLAQKSYGQSFFFLIPVDPLPAGKTEVKSSDFERCFNDGTNRYLANYCASKLVWVYSHLDPFFFELKFTKIDLALKEVIKNRSKVL